MRFIDNNQVKLFFILVVVFTFKNFGQTAIGDKLCFFVNAEQLECISPVVFQSRRINNKDIGVFAVSLYKSLGYHCGNHCLSKTYNIGKEQTVMLHQHLIALNNGIFLIFQILNTIGQLNGKIIFHLVAKSIDKHFDIKLVRSWLITQVCLFLVLVNVICGKGNSLVP